MLLVVVGLEINERPFKRPLLDFEKLSISDSSSKGMLKSLACVNYLSFDFRDEIIDEKWRIH